MRSRFIWNEKHCRPPSRSANHDSNWLIDHLLTIRGYASAAEKQRFLEPDISSLSSPFQLPDADVAVDFIHDAIRRGDTVGVFGDYDADGVTSTAVMTRSLQRIGAQVVTALPQRERDGYGLNARSIDELHSKGARLLIVVDCGTHNGTELEYAQSLGMQTIVIDHHHTKHDSLPSTPFISPRRSDSRYPFPDLAAVGLAYQIGRALTGEDLLDLLPVVALGSVADVVPLRGENRAIVARGLREMNSNPPLGIAALAHASHVPVEGINSTDLGFMLGPRVNAAGRLAIPDPALELFLTDDFDRALRIAEWLNKVNAKRQEDMRKAISDAETLIDASEWADLPVIVVSSPAVRIGIAGLVASRLTDQRYRPSIVFSENGEFSTGSARSIDAFNIVEALHQVGHLLERYGGHSKAAGMTIRTELIDQFREELNQVFLREIGSEVPAEQIDIDAEIALSDVSLETLELLDQLEPFGQENKPPLFLVRDARIMEPRTSRDTRHLMFNAMNGSGGSIRGIAFNQGGRAGQLIDGVLADVVFSLKRDTWQGRVRLSAQVADFRVSQASLLF